METVWGQERLELYDKLARSAQSGLSRDAVLASRCVDVRVFAVRTWLTLSCT
jgi:hypothetical protein